MFFEKNCHATEKSEAIARARRCRSSQLTGYIVDKKIITGKDGGPRRRRATRGSLTPPPPKKKCSNL
jgi:hypothetical protein